MKSAGECIVLTGADGQLGLTLQAQWPGSALADRYRLLCTDVGSLDITDPGQIDRVLAGLNVAAVINAAAYTAVDSAEQDREAAFDINARGAENLARWAAAHGSRLLHISTDFVFAGTATSPYQPDNPAEPLGVYGASKLAGEQAVQAQLPERAVIIRTSWLYSPYQRNFVKTMLRLMAGRERLQVVADQIGSPTSTRTLAQLLLTVLATEAAPGVYHWSDGGAISWYEFAVAIRDEALALGLLDRPAAIEPVTTADYPTPARRPAYSVLDVQSTQAQFACPPRDWRGELKLVLAQLSQQELAQQQGGSQ